MPLAEDLFLRESLRRKLELMREELFEEGSSPLEQLLIERITTAWLWINTLEALLSQRDRLRPSALREMERRLQQADRRYQTAIKQLATIRKLLPKRRQIRESD